MRGIRSRASPGFFFLTPDRALMMTIRITPSPMRRLGRSIGKYSPTGFFGPVRVDETLFSSLELAVRTVRVLRRDINDGLAAGYVDDTLLIKNRRAYQPHRLYESVGPSWPCAFRGSQYLPARCRPGIRPGLLRNLISLVELRSVESAITQHH